MVRGRVVNSRGSGLIGVRVSHDRPKDTGFTLSRQGGWFDLMVNGGGVVKLYFGKSPFLPLIKTVRIGWNQVRIRFPLKSSSVSFFGKVSKGARIRFAATVYQTNT